MAKLQELREQRSEVKNRLVAIREEVDGNRKEGRAAVTPETRAKFEKAKAEYIELGKQIDAEQGGDEVAKFVEQVSEDEQRSAHRGPTPDDPIPGQSATYGDVFGGDRDRVRHEARAETRRALAVQGWAVASGRSSSPSDEQRAAMNECGVHPGQDLQIDGLGTTSLRELRRATRYAGAERRSEIVDRRLPGLVRESRAVVAGSSDRGNLAPQVATVALEQAILTIGGLVNAADVMVTPDGTKMVWPTADDTTNEGRQIDEVTAQSTDGVKPTVGSFSVASYEFTSDFIRVGNVTLRDTPLAFVAAVAAMVGERIARGVNRKATSGDGSSTLRGIEMGSVQGVVMGGPQTYAYDDLVSLKFSVDSAYRMNGAFMMSDEVLVEMMLLKDGEGRPLLVEPNDGSLPRILGRPVITNNHMIGNVASAPTRPRVIFGDLSKYKLRWVGPVRTGVYVEKFAEFDQTGFDGKRGADGGVLNAGGDPIKSMVGPSS